MDRRKPFSYIDPRSCKIGRRRLRMGIYGHSIQEVKNLLRQYWAGSNILARWQIERAIETVREETSPSKRRSPVVF